MTERKTPAARPIARITDGDADKPKVVTDDELNEYEKRQEALAEADELLADMPELKAPHKLRIRERNRLLRLVIEADLLNTTDEVDADNLDSEQMVAMLTVIEGVDDFAESIAVDADAYAEWSEGKDYDTFMALLNRYSVTLGK